MRETFEQMIYRLFTGSMVQFIKNWDDAYEGFEFNPNDPKELIQVKFTMTSSKKPDYEKSIIIERYRMRFYPPVLDHNVIISGPAILLPDGDVDYEFYRKILQYTNLFR
jgi:hypothetical protein